MRANLSIMNLPARAACQLVPQATILISEPLNFFLDDIHLVEKDAAGLLADAAESSIADRARLLVNLLEHEMLVAALFRHDRIPKNVLHLALHRATMEIAKWTPSGVSTAISPSARKNISRV